MQRLSPRPWRPVREEESDILPRSVVTGLCQIFADFVPWGCYPTLDTPVLSNLGRFLPHRPDMRRNSSGP
ncbi:unnamed protein product [Protopolystoma xenopodis]|uniref:Uncharacterized protein n=1 Tax=Protopolystoma xenopodis TaxID=117903 RepID=A0A3S5B193_9PLAT|nr:unnamed protein product [Protopolystoma xenopodis]